MDTSCKNRMWQHVLICLPEIYYFSSSPIFVSENLKVGIDEKSFYVSVDFSRQRKKHGTGPKVRKSIQFDYLSYVRLTLLALVKFSGSVNLVKFSTIGTGQD